MGAGLAFHQSGKNCYVDYYGSPGPTVKGNVSHTVLLSLFVPALDIQHRGQADAFLQLAQRVIHPAGTSDWFQSGRDSTLRE
jgi:hypothetical protein